MDVPLLSGSFTKEEPSGLLFRSGYCFQLTLPGAVDEAERHFLALAWPASYGNSGNRCFYVDERGGVYAASNEAWHFSGTNKRLTREALSSPEFELVH